MTLVQIIVLSVLVGVWAWVLGRPLLMSMLSRSERDTVGHFRRQLSVLGKAPDRSMAYAANGGRSPSGGARGAMTSRGVTSGVSMAPRSPRKRRLQLMMALGMATGMSALLALVFGGIFVAQLVLLVALLGGYVVLAASAGSREAERRQKVAYLGTSGAAAPLAGIRAAGER